MTRHITTALVVLALFAITLPAYAMMGGGGGMGGGGHSSGHSSGGNGYGGGSRGSHMGSDGLTQHMMSGGSQQNHMGTTQNQMGSGQNHMGGQAFDAADTNRDGMMDMGEFHRSFSDMTHEQFMHMDQNGDGMIGHDEWQNR